MTEYVSQALRETAKEILAEVFHARPADVEELWPERFWLEE